MEGEACDLASLNAMHQLCIVKKCTLRKKVLSAFHKEGPCRNQLHFRQTENRGEYNVEFVKNNVFLDI